MDRFEQRPRRERRDALVDLVGTSSTVMAWARWVYVQLALLTIALGLLVHRRGTVLGAVAQDVSGDALWAMMIVWWVGALLPSRPLLLRSATALSVCVIVELSQLLHSPTLDALRRTTLGGLILGHDFDARDLLAYGLGVGAATCIEWWFRPSDAVAPTTSD